MSYPNSNYESLRLNGQCACAKQSRPSNLCFGNLDAHVVTIVSSVLALIAHVAFLVFSEARDFSWSRLGRRVRTADYLVGNAINLLILLVILCLLYGSIRKRPRFYWPAIYVARPIVGIAIAWILCVIVPASKSYSMSSGGEYPSHEYVNRKFHVIESNLQGAIGLFPLFLLLQLLNAAAQDYAFLQESKKTLIPPPRICSFLDY
ncbi:hypothetical protein M3Y99_01735200 [Aphelenchoides fujianensis]|nr:hypothetical protein M3Y99_01735200 [Aphelenchoides fujianensis]